MSESEYPTNYLDGYYSKLAQTGNIDDFLKRADEVNQKVKDIVSGKIDVVEFDKSEKEKE